MKKLTIWIFQTGEPLHVDKGNPRPMRAMNLSNKLVARGHDVILWSSAFSHQKKKHRFKKFTIKKINDNTYGYCEETGEAIGLKRLIARPIATLSIEAQEKHEKNEKIFADT